MKQFVQVIFQKIIFFDNIKKTRLNGVVKSSSVDFNPIDTNDILDIHKYFMKEKQYEIMLEIIKKGFMGLSISIDNASNHTKRVSLGNQKYTIQPILINLHLNQYGQEFHY